MTVPYASIYGTLLSGLLEETMAESGGEREIDSFSGPGRTLADVRESGFGHTTYTFEASSFTRSEIEDLVAEVKNLLPGSEICPREADRCNYVAYAHATRPTVTLAYDGGVQANLYACNVEAACVSGQLMGSEQGIEYCTDVALPQAVSLTNSGYYTSYLDYLYISGKYDTSLGLTKDLLLEMGDYDLRLCDQLMGRDSFKLDRFGNVEHLKETDFPENYATLQAELMGATFLDYGSGGSMAHEALVLSNTGKIMMPFYGPLPIKEAPYLEVTLSALVGYPKVEKAYVTDLSDIEEVDFDLKIGVNKIWIPESEGEDFVAFGITTDSSSSCTISNIAAQVLRYVSRTAIPQVEPDDAFTITVSDGEFSNKLLSGFHLVYRDVF